MVYFKQAEIFRRKFSASRINEQHPRPAQLVTTLFARILMTAE